jgi:mannose-6-phosphate isomerase-like protein (cupin superfamily)
MSMHMTLKSLLAAFVLAGIASVGQAQTQNALTPTAPLHSRPPVPFNFVSRDQLDKLMYRPGDTHSYVVTDHENYDVEFVERGLITNHIENHVHWLDYVTVLEGEGTLAYGGNAVDPDYSNPVEPHGTRMTGATVIPLHPGDYVVVPAGVWHIFSGTANHTLRYVIFKQRE